jgi:hypothetical protein
VTIGDRQTCRVGEESDLNSRDPAFADRAGQVQAEPDAVGAPSGHQHLVTGLGDGHGSLALAGGYREIQRLARCAASDRHDAARDEGAHREHPAQAAGRQLDDAVRATPEGRQ